MLVYITTVDTGLERETIKAYAHRVSHKSDEVKYESSFAVPASFGKVGAILLENEHHKEMYLNNIVLEGFPNGPLHFTCNSWVHSKYDNPHKRIFFNNKVSTSFFFFSCKVLCPSPKKKKRVYINVKTLYFTNLIAFDSPKK